MKFHLGSAHRLLGEIALTTNPTQVAEPLAAPHFEQSIAILQQINAENELALAYAGYGRLHQQQGTRRAGPRRISPAPWRSSSAWAR